MWYPKRLKELGGDKQQRNDRIYINEEPSVAVVTMMHGEAAWRLVYTINTLGIEKMKATFVPANPGMKLPDQVTLDDAIGKPLVEKMKKSYDDLYEKGGVSTTVVSSRPVPEEIKDKDGVPKQLDTQKVAAAAGGHNYDEDADPLNAPQVLKAVQEFRKSLHKVSASQQQRRVQLVQERLDSIMVNVRKGIFLAPPPRPTPPPSNNNNNNNAPPPPPPPPPPGTVPPPVPPAIKAKESGRRGVSNLPAWMTKQREEQAAGGGNQPDAKKPRLDDAKPRLRAYIAAQIAEIMGEEEATLIDFILNHVVERKPWPALLEELKMVLEEEASGFVDGLQKKMAELTGES